MKKYLGTIFLIFGFLEIIVLSAISTFDRVMYEDTNHFIGFINNYGLWPFHYLLLYSNTIKTTPQNSTITEPIRNGHNP